LSDDLITWIKYNQRFNNDIVIDDIIIMKLCIFLFTLFTISYITYGIYPERIYTYEKDYYPSVHKFIYNFFL